METQKLDDYESDENFTLEYIEPSRAVQINRAADHGLADLVMIERESRVLEILLDEGVVNI